MPEFRTFDSRSDLTATRERARPCRNGEAKLLGVAPREQTISRPGAGTDAAAAIETGVCQVPVRRNHLAGNRRPVCTMLHAGSMLARPGCISVPPSQCRANARRARRRKPGNPLFNHVNLARPGLFTAAMLPLVDSLWLSPTRAEESEDTLVVGTGLVIGLHGTGDGQIDERLVERSIVGLFKAMGIAPWDDQVVPGRAAKVIVTAELPLDPGIAPKVTVTPVGNATSLAGGTLLATPLRYATGKVHSVAQGRIVMDGQTASVGREPAAAKCSLRQPDDWPPK